MWHVLFGRNVVWKDKLIQAKQEIISSQKENHKLLAKEIQVQIKELKANVNELSTVHIRLKMDINNLNSSLERMDENVKAILIEVRKPQK